MICVEPTKVFYVQSRQVFQLHVQRWKDDQLFSQTSWEPQIVPFIEVVRAAGASMAGGAHDSTTFQKV